MSQTRLLKALGTIFIICHIYAIQAEPDNMLSQAEVAQLRKEQLPNFIQKRSEMSQSPLEEALDDIINVYRQYAIQEEPSNVLSEAEFAQLRKEQLLNFFEGSKKPKTTDGLFEKRDQNEDGEVSFDKFLNLLSVVFLENL